MATRWSSERYRAVTWPSTVPSGLQRVRRATMMSIRQRYMWCRSVQMSTPRETCVILRSFWRRRVQDICRLLFLGVDWHRKGGDIALAVAELLNQKGIRTELDIVGCYPPRELPAFARCHGFISKKTEEGRNRLSGLMAGSHFLILPSRAECYGIVFAEASSFGLPSLATRVGGIPTAIHDGKNGQTFPLDEGPVKYCDYIETLLSSPQGYRALARSSFNEYSTRLNWSSAGKKVRDLMLEFCA